MGARWVGRIVVAFLLVVIAACGSNGDGNDTDDASDIRELDVRFETSDGVRLTGRLFGTGRVGVTVAHEYPADGATVWYPAAREIARAGYMALAFNFRGYSDSGGPKQIVNAPIDIEAAKTELEKRGARDFVFVGASMGGTASIIAAETGDPLAVVAISAPTVFMGLDAPLSATRIQRPVLLMASRGDQEAFNSLQQLERALPNPENTKIYDGDAHGTNLLNDIPEAIDEIVQFLERYAPLTRAVTTPDS